MKQYSFELNGKSVTVNTGGARRVLDLLREDLQLTGTKEGCGTGECGACTIVVDGVARLSCLMLAAQLADRRVLTIEGLENDTVGARLQQAFVDNGAVQCGYCIPGMALAAFAGLASTPSPTRDDIRLTLSGNLCRCTGYVKIVDAVEQAYGGSVE